jgi:hypothetical protein
LCFLTGCQPAGNKGLEKAQTNSAIFGLNQAKSTIPTATNALTTDLSFFEALLSGDRSTIMSVLSPEISTLTSQYETGRETSESFAPRGGGRGAALEELPFTESNQIEQLVQGARATGAAGVSSIAQLLGELGLGELSAGNTAASSAVGEQQTAQQISAQTGAASGQAIGSLVALLAA